MEVDEVQTQPCRKLPRNDENGELTRRANNNSGSIGASGSGGCDGGLTRLRGWNPSSRIIRVSRASGGKDRHSKVWTSKGLRDRRVRLSVTTAIQFYDLQDRLGYDQPSKAIEWLIKAAADEIAELPSINTSFPDTPNRLSDEKMASNGGNEQGLLFGSGEVDLDGDNEQNQDQTLSLSKSACSSTSETSKNSSALSLSRSEIRGSSRVKARERARERTAKEKDKEKDRDSLAHGQNVQQNSSFTQLLTSGFSSTHHNNNDAGQTGTGTDNPTREWNTAPPVGYFSPILLGSSSSTRTQQGYNGQIQLGNFIPQIPPFSISGENNHHQEPLQQFSFVPDTLIQTAGPSGAGDYSTLNFSINRGTLQSNSQSRFMNNIQRFSSNSAPPMEGPTVPFFMATPPSENHHHNHQFRAGFDGRLQLYYGDGSRCSDQKDKGKS